MSQQLVGKKPKVTITWGWRYICRHGNQIFLDPLGSSSFCSCL